MKDDHASETLLCLQQMDHPQMVCTTLCHLLEHQSLVDVTITCGANSMQAHKCIIAASSPYFREKFEENPKIEVVMLRNIEFPTMKAIIEFIYCGETSIVEENLKYIVAAAKLFQIRGLDCLASEAPIEDGETITILPPLFGDQKPKYSSNDSYQGRPSDAADAATPKEVPDNDPVYTQANTVQTFIEEVPMQYEVNYSDIDIPQVLTTLVPLQCASSTADILPYKLSCVDNKGISDLNADMGILYKMEEGNFVQVASLPDGMQEFVQKVKYDEAFPQYLQPYEEVEPINHGDMLLSLLSGNPENHVSKGCEEPDASQETLDMQRHEREVAAAVLEDIQKSHSMLNNFDLHEPDNTNSQESFEMNSFQESQYSPLDMTDDSKFEDDDGTNNSFQ